ncbi:MAG: glycosyltransferase family 2 protein [Endomicrobia bacterium]|nr:glycosyltransferase family 2 protein [Endomicrobiia bacterium]MCL2507120.1 glycosyltransferase family 2 protein [Endomicrobiia bacterium]
MKLTVAIPVYNRKEILEITKRSLYECNNVDKAKIMVFNDCSTEFDGAYLKNLFDKYDVEIINREKNLRADANTYYILHDFLASDGDVLFICDSDLLLRPDTIDYILNNFPKTDGFLSLYNSRLHEDLCYDEDFVYKRDVGFAGICVSRKLLELFVKKYDKPANALDFKMSEYFITSKIRLLAAKKSLVQHIGFYGQNCKNMFEELAENFVPLSDYNKDIINKYLPPEKVVEMQNAFIKYLLFQDKYKRHGFMVHQPHKYFKNKILSSKLKKYYASKYAVKFSETVVL